MQPGCPAYGDPAPPSALDTIESLGAQLGSTVVIDVGYNDQAEDYAAHLDDVMQALLAAGVRQVVWVTLEEAQEQWGRINEQIRAAPGRWPQLTVADWARAATEPSWFVDGVHMTSDGGLAFADFLRPFVLAGVRSAVCPTPSARDRDRTAARWPMRTGGTRRLITAHGGVPPYRWSVTGLPAAYGCPATAGSAGPREQRERHTSRSGCRTRGTTSARSSWRFASPVEAPSSIEHPIADSPHVHDERVGRIEAELLAHTRGVRLQRPRPAESAIAPHLA